MEKNVQILDYIKEIADTKEVTTELVVLALEDAMKKAYEKEYPEEVAEVKIDANTGAINLYKVYTVVDDNAVPSEEDPDTHQMVKIFNENNEILLSDALKRDKNATVGSTIKEFVDFRLLERRVVLHMLQVFKHDVSIESNKSIYKEWIDKKGTIVYAEVEKYDARSKVVTVNLGKTFGVVTRNELNPDEKLIPGAKYKFVIKDVLEQTKGWPIILSRASGELVKDLLHTNIPEIQTNVVEIMKVGRAVGFKTKVAVRSNQPGIDPIGACIGAKADRIRPIMQEMGNEKIEFVQWDDDFGKFLVNACNPAPIVGYKIVDAVMETDELGNTKEVERKKVIIVVDEFKLALIIGSRGKNVRILSELLDANVEIMTTEEANEEKIVYTKAERIPYRVEQTEKPKPVNKFGSTYDKYHSSATDLLESINEANDIVDNATIAENAKVEQEAKVEEQENEQEPAPVEEEPIAELSDTDLSSYADDLAALDELTKDANKK